MSTLETIESLKKDVEALKQDGGSARYAIEAVSQTLQRVMSLEQSLASLGKAVTAILEELVETKTIDQDKVYARIRKRDEAATEREVNEMLSRGMIKQVESVDENSLVIVSQLYIGLTEPAAITVAEYRTVEMPSQLTPAYVRSSLLGKKAGEQVTLPSEEKEEGCHVLTVKAVYTLVEGERSGEPAVSETETGEVANVKA